MRMENGIFGASGAGGAGCFQMYYICMRVCVYTKLLAPLAPTVTPRGVLPVCHRRVS